MDPSPPTRTGHFLQNEADAPRTCDLKDLRAKRVAYYESIGVIRGEASRSGSQQVSAASRDIKVNPSENQTRRPRGPQMSPCYLAIGKKPLLQEESTEASGEAEQSQEQRAQEEPWRKNHPPELDLQLLADAWVPEIQKLRHVINWAEKFLSNPPEEHGSKSPTASLKLPRSNLCLSSKALGSKRNACLRSSDSPPLLREDQSSTRTDIHSCSSSLQNDASETGLFSKFPSSFLMEGFPGSQPCGWQDTTVRSEGEAQAAGCPPDSWPLEDSAQQECDRAGKNHIQTPNEDEVLPEGLGTQPQLKHTFEESKVLEETGQSPPRSGYFWTPLTDSSEEEHLDEPGERKGTPRRDVLGRKYRRFSGIASFPPSDSTPLLSEVSSSGETPLEADVREECRGAVAFPVGPPQDVTAEFKADSSRGEDPIQRLPGSQSMLPSGSSNGRIKESDNVGFTLGFPQTDIKHKNEWKHAITESAGKTVTGRVPRGCLNKSVQSPAKSSRPVITQKQLDLTRPESYVAPQMASLSLHVSEGPWENPAFHVRSGTSVFRGPTAEAQAVLSSVGFDQQPAPGVDSRPVQTPRVVTRQTTHEQKEKIPPSGHPVSREISEANLKGSFPLQDVGDSLSCRDEPPHKPDQGAGVLETYFYYLRMPNKIRGLSSEESNSSLPFQGPRLSKSELVITCPEGRGRSKGASLDREAREWRDGSEGRAAAEGEGGTHPQGRGSAEEAAPEETSFWKPQGNYEFVEKFFCKNVPRDVERGNEEHKRDADFSQWLLLPEEIWICIFSLLSHKELARVAQVCRHFHRLASDESLWKQIQIADCCVLEDDWLVALGRRQPRSLTLHRCRLGGQAVTGQGLKRLFQHCGDVLQELNVTSCSGPGLTGDKILLHAGALCSRLTAVDLSWSGATDVGVLALIQGVSSLQGLSVNGCQVTDKAIEALVKKHGNSLHKIEVFGCLALTTRSVGSLALQCPHLRTLNIGRVPKVSEACLVRSLENLREGTALNVAGLKMVRDQIVHLIVTQCPKLDSLVLSSCFQVTDLSLVEISTHLRTLRYLDVSGCRQVTNAGIHALARRCHQLKYLDLSSTGISKGGVCSLANYCHISLECVKLSFCKNVTLDVVKKLCKNCRRLKILHLYGCTITSDLCKIKEAYGRVQVFHDMSALTC